MSESELTTRARAVLAGLTEDERFDWGTAEGREGWLIRADHVSRFARIGLVVGGDAVWAAPGLMKVEPTDLGREVARLLAEGGA